MSVTPLVIIGVASFWLLLSFLRREADWEEQLEYQIGVAGQAIMDASNERYRHTETRRKLDQANHAGAQLIDKIAEFGSYPNHADRYITYSVQVSKEEYRHAIDPNFMIRWVSEKIARDLLH